MAAGAGRGIGRRVVGVGLGLVFVPLNTLAFATVASHLRVDATAFFSLVRNVGQGI